MRSSGSSLVWCIVVLELIVSFDDCAFSIRGVSASRRGDEYGACIFDECRGVVGSDAMWWVPAWYAVNLLSSV